MKNKIRLLLASALVLAAAASPARAQTAKAVDIKANDTMKFDVTHIQAAEGQPIVITYTNAGTLPKVAMGHNLVILKPGTDIAAFVAAAAKAAGTNYIPPELKSSVIAATRILGPGESETLTVDSLDPGTYDYICTFPAHEMAGMHGTITVK